MSIKLFEAEMKIMTILWREGDISAKDIAIQANSEFEWSKTTTYTVIKKCIQKGAIERRDPSFICHALITKEDVQEFETQELISKVYNGSADQLVSTLLGGNILNKNDIHRLKKIIKDWK